MNRKLFPLLEQIQSLPYFGQTYLGCRFLRRISLSLFRGDELTIAIDFCDELEKISRDGVQQESAGENPRPLLPQLLEWKPSQLAQAFGYGRDAIESALEGKRACIESKVSHFVILLLCEVYKDPRFSQMQLAILLNSDVAQLSYVCREAKLTPWDGVTDYVLARLTPCHALDLVEPPITLEDEFR